MNEKVRKAKKWTEINSSAGRNISLIVVASANISLIVYAAIGLDKGNINEILILVGAALLGIISILLVTIFPLERRIKIANKFEFDKIEAALNMQPSSIKAIEKDNHTGNMDVQWYRQACYVVSWAFEGFKSVEGNAEIQIHSLNYTLHSPTAVLERDERIKYLNTMAKIVVGQKIKYQQIISTSNLCSPNRRAMLVDEICSRLDAFENADWEGTEYEIRFSACSGMDILMSADTALFRVVTGENERKMGVYLENRPAVRCFRRWFQNEWANARETYVHLTREEIEKLERVKENNTVRKIKTELWCRWLDTNKIILVSEETI